MTKIIPSMKIGKLLEEFPQLEETLIECSPQFKKLKNPVLRRTVANIVTLQQAAQTGGLPLNQLVNTLRVAAGQPPLDLDGPSGDSTKPRPAWLDQHQPIVQLDVTETIQSGGVPLAEVLEAAQALEPDHILELTVPFLPTPIIEKLENEGFKTWSNQLDDHFITYFTR